MRGCNGDLWERLKTAVDDCPWKITIKWVNSHPKEALEVQTGIPADVYKGNRRADQLAGEAAEEVELQAFEVDRHKEATTKAKEIMARITTISLDMYKQRTFQKHSSVIRTRASLVGRLKHAKETTDHHVVEIPKWWYALQ